MVNSPLTAPPDSVNNPCKMTDRHYADVVIPPALSAANKRLSPPAREGKK